MTKQPTVYLAGLISTDCPASILWRPIAAAKLIEAEFSVLSPLRGKDHLLEKSPDGGVTHPSLTAADVILRDYNDVCACDLLLVHLSLFGSCRPSIGTLFELGWAWQMRKPVIGVSPVAQTVRDREHRSLLRTHPFLVQAISHYFDYEDDAVDFIISQWRR